MSARVLASGPHAHSQASVSRVMMLVALALTPATAFGFYQFGWPAVFLFLVTITAALGFEALCLKAAGRPVGRFLLDGSALLAGWLVAITLPPWAPWWLGVLGAGIAIVIAKHVYGGLGQNLFNPAMVARVMLLISFPVQMTAWVLPPPMGAPGAPGILDGLAITFLGRSPAEAGFDTVSAATPISHMKTELSRGLTLEEISAATPDLMDLALGAMPGSMGETSAALLLLGGLALIAMRLISWRIPVAVLGTTALLALITHWIDPSRYPSAAFHLTSGSLMLCAFFIATDYVTSPSTALGQLIYGASIGALIFIIRSWAAFPEGVGFAVLLLNACTPLLDHYIRPRVFGRDRRGKPLDPTPTPRGAARRAGP
ncbi:MAG: RnfABCDGE type electron transport complex subunit D [Pseudomonadota bacterium]